MCIDYYSKIISFSHDIDEINIPIDSVTTVTYVHTAKLEMLLGQKQPQLLARFEPTDQPDTSFCLEGRSFGGCVQKLYKIKACTAEEGDGGRTPGIHFCTGSACKTPTCTKTLPQFCTDSFCSTKAILFFPAQPFVSLFLQNLQKMKRLLLKPQLQT